jgi:hypothetical protein
MSIKSSTKPTINIIKTPIIVNCNSLMIVYENRKTVNKNEIKIFIPPILGIAPS